MEKLITKFKSIESPTYVFNPLNFNRYLDLIEYIHIGECWIVGTELIQQAIKNELLKHYSTIEIKDIHLILEMAYHYKTTFKPENPDYKVIKNKIFTDDFDQFMMDKDSLIPREDLFKLTNNIIKMFNRVEKPKNVNECFVGWLDDYNMYFADVEYDMNLPF